MNVIDLMVFRRARLMSHQHHVAIVFYLHRHQPSTKDYHLVCHHHYNYVCSVVLLDKNSYLLSSKKEKRENFIDESRNQEPITRKSIQRKKIFMNINQRSDDSYTIFGQGTLKTKKYVVHFLIHLLFLSHHSE